MDFVGRIGGRVLFLMSRDKRNLMSKELRLVLPSKSCAEIREIIKRSFINYCLSELEVLLYPVMNREFILKYVRIEGKEHLDEALLDNKGVLLFQAHFGAFQMVMAGIGYNDYKMSQISASASMWKEEMVSWVQKRSFEVKARYEYCLPVEHISVKSSLRPAFRALERNEIVGITVDGGLGKRVVETRFLGRKANFQRGGPELAIRTGAKIIPAFIITEKGLRHRLIIHAPIEVRKDVDKDEKVEAILKDFAGILENHVYCYPDHYAYLLYMRRANLGLDTHPFFTDYNMDSEGCNRAEKLRGNNHGEEKQVS